MSFFNWFSGKSGEISSFADRQAKQALASREKSPAASAERPAAEAGSQEHKRKLERYARREQLYIAIREAMTRAGILSASYKFKVLSLDRRDSEFLVMMDLGKLAGDLTVKTGEIEALVVHNAKARFDITVSAVYWRVNATTAASKPMSFAPEASVVVNPARKAAPLAHESIEADEMAAFQHALMGAAARRPEIAPDPLGKSRKRRDIRNWANKSENPEASDSVSPRSLSGTQYGELN